MKPSSLNNSEQKRVLSSSLFKRSSTGSIRDIERIMMSLERPGKLILKLRYGMLNAYNIIIIMTNQNIGVYHDDEHNSQNIMYTMQRSSNLRKIFYKIFRNIFIITSCSLWYCNCLSSSFLSQSNGRSRIIQPCYNLDQVHQKYYYYTWKRKIWSPMFHEISLMSLEYESKIRS